MDDEQPTFKVTDRRLFNPDGSPRDLPEEPIFTTPSAPVLVTPAESNQQPLKSVASDEPPKDKPDPAVGSQFEDDELSPEELEGVNDPASFINFVMSIASNAAASLGMMEHPVTHERDVDLELGKHWIDVLGMLQKKTKGNVTAQEQKMLDGLLSDLRMQFVSLNNVPQKARSFSGKDITGGR